MIDKQLLRACASLGIRLVHSRPGQPAGRGKIERFFRTVREQFLVEIGSGRELADLVQLNTLFTAWGFSGGAYKTPRASDWFGLVSGEALRSWRVIGGVRLR